MLNDLTRLKIKLNEIISQGVVQYHCIHYRAAVLESTRDESFWDGNFSRLTKADNLLDNLSIYTRFKQLFLISNGYPFSSFFTIIIIIILEQQFTTWT